MLADWFARLGPLAPSRPTMALFETSKKKRRGNWITIIFSIEIKEAGLPVGGNRRLPPAMLFFHHQTCKNIYQKEIISYANDAGPRKTSPAVTLSLFYSADKVAACVPLLSHPPIPLLLENNPKLFHFGVLNEKSSCFIYRGPSFPLSVSLFSIKLWWPVCTVPIIIITVINSLFLSALVFPSFPLVFFFHIQIWLQSNIR